MKTNWKITTIQHENGAYIKLVVKIDKQQHKLLYYIGTLGYMLYEFFYKGTWDTSELIRLLKDIKGIEALQKISTFLDGIMKSVEGVTNENLTEDGQLKTLIKEEVTQCEKPDVQGNKVLDHKSMHYAFIKLMITILYFILKLMTSD